MGLFKGFTCCYAHFSSIWEGYVTVLKEAEERIWEEAGTTEAQRAQREKSKLFDCAHEEI